MRSPAVGDWLSRVRRARGVSSVLQARDHPTRVTSERIAACLTERRYRFVKDADGDLTGSWDGNRFWFMLLGVDKGILQVRGRWHRTLPTQRRGMTIRALNDWNRERTWPKVYVREEDGELALYSEVSADLVQGATDAQLAQLLTCGLGTGLHVFTVLDTGLAVDEPE